jgi:hypothetical protein
VSGSTSYNGNTAATSLSLSATGNSARIGLLTYGATTSALYIGFYLLPGTGIDTITIQYNISG